MKFAISDKTLRRLLVGVAVVTILLLIFFRVRSKYAYPDLAAAAKGVATVSRSDQTTEATATSPGVVTITTTAAHGYAAGDVIIYGSSAYVVLSAPSTTTFTINAPDKNAFTATSTFKPAYKTLKDALDQCNVDNQNNPNSTTFDNCIKTQTEAYVKSMCPWTESTNVPTQATAPSTVWQAKQNFDADVAAIRDAYVGLQNSVSTDLTPVLNAARRADLTGATRKYLSAACPGYYAPAAGGTVPAGYTTWRTSLTTLPNPASTGIVTYFDASLVKFTNTTEKNNVRDRLVEWAKYATSDTAGTTPLITGCTLHTNLNWKLAQQYGPGTVTTAATLPWNTQQKSTCPKDNWTLV
jgi:hypothetical protein